MPQAGGGDTCREELVRWRGRSNLARAISFCCEWSVRTNGDSVSTIRARTDVPYLDLLASLPDHRVSPVRINAY